MTGRRVVVVDVLRASTTVCAAFAAGFAAVETYATPYACHQAGQRAGVLTAGERGGIQLPGFRFGNSPLELLAAAHPHSFGGQTLALTSTNCTQVVAQALPHAAEVLIACHANLSIVAGYLARNNGLPLTLACAGWHGDASYEDTLFCGALAARLLPGPYVPDDATALALGAWQAFAASPTPMRHLLRRAGHARKLWRMGQAHDVAFCHQPNTLPALPLWQGGAFCNLWPD